ncbi:MAG: ubiquinol-cytochrome c reductase iron-sulfur subunit [Candidatus Tectomicrobia bacterium]|nr:ubiquinol-cytochrome c reductase iron-sulfur subunit [Candidatus Tectomicrobia bacterium]
MSREPTPTNSRPEGAEQASPQGGDSSPRGNAARQLDRRTFCLWTGFGGLSLASLISGYNLVRFMKPNVVDEPPATFSPAPVADLPADTVNTQWVEDQKVWLVRRDARLYALVSICTHLACTPRWTPSEQVFRCPCHGSVFDLEGDVVKGPAPEPLYRSPLHLTRDGRLLVRNGLAGIRLPEQANQPGQRDRAPFVINA